MDKVVLFVFLCGLPLVYTQVDPDCQFGTVSVPTKMLPKMKMTSFSTQMSGKDLVNKLSLFSRHSINFEGRQVAIHTEYAGKVKRVIVDYNKMTVLTIDEKGCYLKSFTSIPHDRDGAMVHTIYNITQSTGYEKYKGLTEIRGIPTDNWLVCHKDSGTGKEYSYDIYMTPENSGWNMPSGRTEPIPVRVIVKGQDGSRKMNVLWDYIDFHDLDIKGPLLDFDIPDGIYCPNVPVDVKPPDFPKAMSYKSEVKFRTDHNYVILNKVLYDTAHQFSREDRTTLYGYQRATEGYTLIRDFNEGMMYNIQPDGKCYLSTFNSVAQSHNVSLPYLDDEDMADDGFEHMKTVQQFFHADGNFNYNKRHAVRGITCDMFTRNFKLYGTDTQIRLYFAANTTTENTSGQSSEVHHQLIRWVQHDKRQTSVEDIYDFVPNPRWTQNPFDVRGCYNDSQKINFDLSLHGDYLYSAKIPDFARLVSQKVTKTLGIGVARFHWDEVFFRSNGIHLMGTLIDKGPDFNNFAKSTGKRVDASKLPSGSKGKNSITYPSKNFKVSFEVCAALCDRRYAMWDNILPKLKTCDSFDFCDGKCTFYFGHSKADITRDDYLKPATDPKCNYYHKIVNILPEPDLATAWTKLKDAVYNHQITIQLGEGQQTKKTYTAYQVANLNVELDEMQKHGSPLHDYTVLKNVDNNQGTRIGMTTLENCADSCTKELYDVKCESFTYCSKLKKCVIRETRPENKTDPKTPESEAGCNTYLRTYLADFDKLPGKSVLTDTAKKTVTAKSPEDCAKQCEAEGDFKCESMDFCTTDPDNNCALSDMHYYQHPATAKTTNENCTHYSRNFLFDYMKSSSTVHDPTNARVIEGVGLTQCAVTCSTDIGVCKTFYFCEGDQSCRIEDKNTNGTTPGQVSGKCYSYTRRPGVSRPGSHDDFRPPANTLPYTQGSMAGLGIGAIILGVVLAVIVLVVISQVRSARFVDTNKIRFTREELSDA